MGQASLLLPLSIAYSLIGGSALVCAESCLFRSDKAICTPQEDDPLGITYLVLCQYYRRNRLFADQAVLHTLVDVNNI